MKLNLTLSRKGFILIAVPLVFELVFVAVLLLLLHESELETEREAHSKDIYSTTNSIQRIFVECASVLLLYGGTRSDFLQARYELLRAQVPTEFILLRRLVQGNLRQEQAFLKLQPLADKIMHLFQDLSENDSEDPAVFYMQLRYSFPQMELLVKQFIDQSREISLEESRIADVRPARSFRTPIAIVLGVGVAGNILLAVGLAIYFNRTTSTRLATLMDNTVRLGRGQDLQPILEGADEIAQLDRVFHDMAAALAEAARKERATIDHAVDVICSFDKQWHFIAASPASEKVWGYLPTELIGTSCLALLTDDDVETASSLMHKLIESGTPMAFENSVMRKDGVIVETLWSACWSAKEQSLFCVAHDFTERKQAAQLRRDVVSMVSHDLRTPLTSINSSISLATAGAFGELNAGLQETLAIAERNSIRLIALVTDILDLEKLEAGKMPMNFQDTAIAPVIEQAVEAVHALAGQYRITVESDNTDLSVRADGDRLVQVLVNLLSNAIKFSPAGTRVKVTTESDNESVSIVVHDSGPGISEADLPRIFDRFGKSTDNKRIAGTGLGLAICKYVIDLHGGTISATSVLGQGSSFIIKLPK